MEKKTIKLLLADDHAIFMSGIRAVLKSAKHIEIAGEALDGEELLKLAYEIEADVVLMDVMMPVMDGIDATKALRKARPSVKVIALSMWAHDKMIIEMLEAGALGYLLKTANPDEIIRAIETVNENRPYFGKEIAESVAQMISRNHQPLHASFLIDFSDREKSIMRLICQEYTSKEIALKMKLSKRTVESHRVRIMDKIGARGIAGIITYAIRTGVFKPGTTQPKHGTN